MPQSMSTQACVLADLMLENTVYIGLHTTLECAWPDGVCAAPKRRQLSAELSRRPEMQRRKSTVMRWRRINRRLDCDGVNCARARIRTGYG